MKKRRNELLSIIREKLQEFDQLYPTEEDCVDALFRWMFADGKHRCERCKSWTSEKQKGSRLVECLSCKRTSRFTAGTFFHRVRKVRERLAIIWLIEARVVINSSLLHLSLDLAASTAWKIFHEINNLVAMKMRDNSLPQVCVENFRNIIAKRSFHSLAFEHPSIELDHLLSSGDEIPGVEPLKGETTEVRSTEHGSLETENDRTGGLKTGSPGNERNETESPKTVQLDSTAPTSCSDNIKDSSQEKIIEFLKAGQANFDAILRGAELEYKDLCTGLCMLELAGEIERDFGEIYRLSRKRSQLSVSPDKHCDKAISESRSWIQEVFGGVSLRYLQNYLAHFWLRADSKTWSRDNHKLLELILSAKESDRNKRFAGCLFVDLFVAPQRAVSYV